MFDNELTARDPVSAGGRAPLTTRDLTELVTALADIGSSGGAAPTAARARPARVLAVGCRMPSGSTGSTR